MALEPARRLERVAEHLAAKLAEVRELSWFSVRGRVAIRVGGQTGGLQTVEERIVLLRAYSEDDALRRLDREWHPRGTRSHRQP